MGDISPDIEERACCRRFEIPSDEEKDGKGEEKVSCGITKREMRCFRPIYAISPVWVGRVEARYKARRQNCKLGRMDTICALCRRADDRLRACAISRLVSANILSRVYEYLR